MSSRKSPVQYLSEICTKKEIFQKYLLLEDEKGKVEGPVHEPVFKYRLTIEYENKKLEEIGCGKSKKDAKHNTALAILKAMNISTKELFGECYGEAGPVEMEATRAAAAGADDDVGNPVGLLQELCMKMKLPPPTYELASEEGLPHERIFAMACKVGEHYKEVGKGKSKKLAKRNAAHLMAHRLRNIPSEIANVHGYDDDDDKIIEGLNAQNAARESNGKKLKNATNGDVDKISHLYKRYQNLVLDKIPMLKDSNVEIEDPIDLLANLEGSAQPMYIDFDELSTNQVYQCLVQITCDPPVVAIGEGKTREEAKINAAKDAIIFFRTLLVN